MLSFMLNIKVKKEFEQKAVEVLSGIEKNAHRDLGCITFMWFQQIDEPLKFTLIEQWENQEVLNEHIKNVTPAWNEFVPCLDGNAVSTKLHKLIQ